MSATLNDIATEGQAIDYLVERGFKGSEAVEFIARIVRLGKKTKAKADTGASVLPKAPKKAPHRMPERFSLTPELTKFATDRGLSRVEVDQQWTKFHAHHQMKGSEFVDWNAAWRTWAMRAVEYKTRDGRGPNNGPAQYDGRL